MVGVAREPAFGRGGRRVFTGAVFLNGMGHSGTPFEGASRPRGELLKSPPTRGSDQPRRLGVGRPDKRHRGALSTKCQRRSFHVASLEYKLIALIEQVRPRELGGCPQRRSRGGIPMGRVNPSTGWRHRRRLGATVTPGSPGPVRARARYGTNPRRPRIEPGCRHLAPWATADEIGPPSNSPRRSRVAGQCSGT